MQHQGLKFDKFALLLILLYVIPFTCQRETAENTEISGDALLDSLSQFKAEYRWNDANHQYILSNKQKLDQYLTGEPREEVRTLVNCLNDQTLSQVTLEGERVALGIVCYEALTQLVYYEPTGPEGDIAGEWPGYIQPTASYSELVTAQKAWNEVVEKQAYIFQ